SLPSTRARGKGCASRVARERHLGDGYTRHVGRGQLTMSRDSDNENSRLGRDGPPMQRTSSPSGGGRVDIERLAAFVDGRCAPAEHQEVLRQLAGSPDDLELVADIEALRDEEAREEEPPQVIPLGSRRRSTRWRRWWPLAAAAAVAFVAIPLTKGSSDA